MSGAGDAGGTGRVETAWLTALAEGAGGDRGRRAVEELARVVGLGAGASVRDIAEAAADPARRDAVREWGEAVAGLLAVGPPGGGTSRYGGDHTDFRGGVFLREVVGVQVVVHEGGAAGAEAVAGLPPRPGGFTGREREKGDLLRALDPAGAPTPLVAAVSGLGGIGKTALAVETACVARERGWFPGGVLFIDLHGYDDPVSADRALAALLRALGTPPEHLPAASDERAALYRSTLATRARERGAVLILADNASSPDQVRPLLPGDPLHRALVTSRDRMPQLGARLVALDQLGAGEAYAVLDRALRIADPHDGRVAEDAGVSERLAGLCGHLPLALQIAAALLAEDPGKPVTELVTELAESHDRLAALDDGERSVRAAFELSYRRLPDEPARLLRLLALAPGPEASDEVVAALLGAERPPARVQQALVRAHLVERGRERGRWRLHDLVRAFGASAVARDPALREEGDAARERLLDFYARTAGAADDRLRWRAGRRAAERSGDPADPEGARDRHAGRAEPDGSWGRAEAGRFGGAARADRASDGVEAGPFRDRAEALAWLDGERAGLVAAVGWGREQRFAGAAVRLAAHLGEYLDWRRRFDEGAAVGRAARLAARRAGDRAAEAAAWNRTGIALRGESRLTQAYDAHRRAAELHAEAGDDNGRGTALSNLGAILGDVGRVGEAEDTFRIARDLFRATGDRHSEAGVWNNLALVLRRSGRVDEALDALRTALGLYRATGDRARESRAWHNYGVALSTRGCTAQAVTACLNSLDISRELDDRHGSARTLYALALVHDAAGNAGRARAHMVRAAEAYERAGSAQEAEQARRAARITGPAPTGTPAPAGPPDRRGDCGPRGPRPPGAPGNGGP